MNKKKRELEQNELADAIDSYYEQIQPYISRIIAVSVVIILAVVAIAFWTYTQRRINEGQWEEFLDSTRYSDLRGMDEVANIYPDAPAGQFALIRAADYDYARGMSNIVRDRNDFKDKMRKAIDRYEKLVSDDRQVEPFLKQRALFAMAHGYESLGEFDKAIGIYQQLLDNAPDASITIMARKGIERLSDPIVVGIYEQFKQWQPEMTGPAAGPLLPERPNISFPSAEPEPVVDPSEPAAADDLGTGTDDSAAVPATDSDSDADAIDSSSEDGDRDDGGQNDPGKSSSDGSR